MDFMFHQQAVPLHPSRWGSASSILCEFWCSPRSYICAYPFFYVLMFFCQPAMFLTGSPMVSFSVVLSITSHLGRIPACGSTNHICSNPFKTSVLSVSPRRLPYSPQLDFDSTSTESLSSLYPSINSSLC